MFHRIKFLLLIVSSLSCNFNGLTVPFVFIVHDYRLQEYSKMLRVSNALQDYTSLELKPLNNQKKITKYSLLYWNVTLLKFIQTLDHTDSSHWEWEPAGRMDDFGNFLNGFAKSARLIILNID